MPDKDMETIFYLQNKLQKILAYAALGMELGCSLNEQQLNIGKALMSYYSVNDLITNAILTNKGE